MSGCLSWQGCRGWCVVVVAVVAVMVGVFAAPVFAVGVAPAPGLTIHTIAAPSYFSQADDAACEATTPSSELLPPVHSPPCDEYRVTVTNSGGVATGSPVVITDEVPEGLEVLASNLLLAKNQLTPEGESPEGEETGECTVTGRLVTCETGEQLLPDERLDASMILVVEAGAVAGENKASVSEAGVTVASTESDDVISSEPAGFGASALVSQVSAPDGASDVQAGDHPYEQVTRFDLNTDMRRGPEGALLPTTPGHGLRDVVVDLPPGFVGSAVATPKCTFAQLQSFVGCPSDTMVGHINTEPKSSGDNVNLPVFDMVAERGVAAEFGFDDVLHTTHVIYASIAPTPEGYVVRATAREAVAIQLWDVISTLYGDPSAKQEEVERRFGFPLSPITPAALFTNPSDCSGAPLKTTAYVDSWLNPGGWRENGTPEGEPLLPAPGEQSNWKEAVSESPPVTGCEQLRFDASMSVTPDTDATDSQTGLSFDLKIPQQTETPETLATPPLRDTTVTLPAGLIPNPAAAPALAGCSEAQIGWLGGSLTNFTAAAPTCPNASKIGSVEVVTPLLEKPLVGSLYLAKQNENPFASVPAGRSVLAGYIVIDDPTTGVVVKVPGELFADPSTGQITGTFDEAPQMPFSELKLRFFGGTPGEVATPEGCGSFTSSGLFTPWSTPTATRALGSFSLSSGCAQGFAPAFSASTSSPQAGSYSPFTLSFSRQDSEQDLSGLTVTLPPGLEAKIAGVGKCPESALAAAEANPSGAAEIADPSCPASSEVGTVQSSSGVGPDPLVLSGKAYLTGPYKGAPLGLAVIVPAIAGPLDLGNVVVRSALFINPSDGHVTAVSDPLPSIIDATGANGHKNGFQDRIRAVNITLNRAGYVIDPTNCTPMSITAAFTSTTGTASTASTRFQVIGCGELPFTPSFKVSTQGHASKAGGASLHVHVTSAPGQANIGKTKVDLPKQLPSRLTTLQKACLASVFAANPAACPEASLVGTATATSPLIAAPFTGPAYLVSYGSAKFPDLELVLQSEGITLVLDGHTDIKHGITISDFETLPDAPVSSFELTLPTGPYSALATDLPEKLHYNLCGQTLNMPTLITGQNGATVKQTTKINITGCPTAKHTKKKTKPKKKKHK
jgi:hypothetical protein